MRERENPVQKTLKTTKRFKKLQQQPTADKERTKGDKVKQSCGNAVLLSDEEYITQVRIHRC